MRLGGIGLDLLSKVGDEDAQVIGLVAIVGSPYRLQQFPVGDRFAGVRDQVTQKVEFFGSQANGFFSRSDLSCFEIDLEVAR